MPSILNQIINFYEGDYAFSIILVSNYNDENHFRNLLLSTDVASSFKATMSEKITKLINNINRGKNDLIEYDPGYKKDSHQIEYLDITDTNIEELIDNFPTVGGIQNFDPKNDEEFLNNIRFYVMLFKNSYDEEIKVFRKANEKIELNRKGFATYLNDGLYDVLDKSLFYFDEKYDCFLYGSKMYIKSTYNFHLMFKYYEKMRENADKILNDIEPKVPIENMDEFREACKGQLNMLAKVRNISSKDYFDYITMDHIEETIEKCDLEIEVVGTGDNKQLVYDSSERWLILKLLDDDYLGSIMTDKTYESNSKKDIS